MCQALTQMDINPFFSVFKKEPPAYLFEKKKLVNNYPKSLNLATQMKFSKLQISNYVWLSVNTVKQSK